MKINIGVLYGGKSTEHEISVISAVQAMNNMNKEKYNIIPIYMDKENTMYYSPILQNISLYKDIKSLKAKCKEVLLTRKNKEFVLQNTSFPYQKIATIDLAFPIMHGYNTEDGNISGYLEVLGIPYAQSDIFSSTIAQDKVFQKAVLKEAKVNVIDYYAFLESDFKTNQKEIINEISKLDYPVIVKPARQGSSVGIGVAKNQKELISAIEDAINYDEKILVEKYIKDLKEYNISVLGNNDNYQVSQIEEVYSKNDILSFEDKYLSDSKTKGMSVAGRKIPAELKPKIKETIENFAISAAKAINISGITRIDFILDPKDNKVYLNEMNITPGSLAFYLWDKPYKSILDDIINCGIKKFQNKSKKLSSFDTNVLSNFNGTKGIKK